MSRCILLVYLAASLPLMALGQSAPWQPNLTRQQTYTAHRASSADPTGANADRRKVAPGATLTLLDTDGPGLVSHLWFTIASSESYHLKRIVLRIYWDGEQTPSVEAPIGDFFGLGLGYYNPWQSEMLSVGSVKDLNCFFPMPFQRHARITVTNEGKQLINALYYNIDYRTGHNAPGGGHFIFPRAVSPGATQSWVDKSVDIQRRPRGEQEGKPYRPGQLRVGRCQGKRPVRGRDHVHLAKPERLVGRG